MKKNLVKFFIENFSFIIDTINYFSTFYIKNFKKFLIFNILLFLCFFYFGRAILLETLVLNVLYILISDYKKQPFFTSLVVVQLFGVFLILLSFFIAPNENVIPDASLFEYFRDNCPSLSV